MYLSYKVLSQYISKIIKTEMSIAKARKKRKVFCKGTVVIIKDYL
nr:MAG TPA: hypothetical protein [Caudoviricetes sp.]